jgi:hypothetical protein
MNGTAVSYATNSLQTSWINTSGIRHESMGTKQAVAYLLAHANGQVIPYTEYNSKVITLQGTIVGNGITDTDQKLDTFRGYFAKDGQNLDISYAGATRRYVCVPTSVDIDRPNGLSYAYFTVTLVCLSGFGQDTSSSFLVPLTTGLTSANRTDNITVPGSATYQLPIATVTLTAVSATGSQTMTFANNNNGQGVTVTRSGWAVTDVVTFDSLNRQVLVNGTVTDYSGSFIELNPGSQSINISNSFTSATYSYQVLQYTRWF